MMKEPAQKMTVGELIAMLQALPADAPVVVDGMDGIGSFYPYPPRVVDLYVDEFPDSRRWANLTRIADAESLELRETGHGLEVIVVGVGS